MEDTKMQSVIIIQLTPSISHVVTAFLHSLHKTCNLQQKWTAHMCLWKLLVWLLKTCTFCPKKNTSFWCTSN